MVENSQSRGSRSSIKQNNTTPTHQPVHVPAQLSWWQRFLIICCNDAQSEVTRPESSSMPDNLDLARQMHAHSYQDLNGDRINSYHSSALEQSQLLRGERPPEKMTRAEQIFQEEVRSVTILLEHYKLQLTTVLPKVCLVVRKAQKKGAKKLSQTQEKIAKSIEKVRVGQINEWGPKFNCSSDAEFNTKLQKYKMLDKDIQTLDLEVQTAINKAMSGQDPELVIIPDDSNLDMDKYQLIMYKVYSVIRHKVYHSIQKKIRANKNQKKQKSNPNMNDSVVSTQSLAIGEEDITALIQQLDIEEIQRDVFALYGIKAGLDTTLSLRKLKVTEADDEFFQNYLECLQEAHDRFLSYVFQGCVFGKMQENPLHSTDLQHGVPMEFNTILNELFGDNTGFEVNEEEYKMQMNLSLSQIPMETPVGDQAEGIQERMLTQVNEQSESTPKGSEHYLPSNDPSQGSAQIPLNSSSPPSYGNLPSGSATVRASTAKKVSFGESRENDGGMIFQQIDDAEKAHQRTKSFGNGRRKTEVNRMRPVSVSKMDLAQKLSRQTIGGPAPKKQNKHDQSFDQLLRD